MTFVHEPEEPPVPGPEERAALELIAAAVEREAGELPRRSELRAALGDLE